MEAIMTALAIALWMALGAAIALLCVVLRGRRLWRRGSAEGAAIFGAWLDRPCSVQLNGRWTDGWSIVAVSHKGAVAVRREGASRAKWIPKQDVPERVRWTDGDALRGAQAPDTGDFTD